MTDESFSNCIDCNELIRLNARKCHHCGSFQDWRRFSMQSTTTLSLLIALITVSTFAYNSWRSQNPITGIHASTRIEQTEEILDLINTGEVSIAVKSVRIALRVGKQTSAPSDTSVNPDYLRYANEILQNVSLRSIGIINPKNSKSLKIEYIPGLDYSDQIAFRGGSVDKFNDILLALQWQSEDLPAFKEEILCEYTINYAFISKHESSKNRELKLSASCKSVSRIGSQHMKAFCAKEGEFCKAE